MFLEFAEEKNMKAKRNIYHYGEIFEIRIASFKIYKVIFQNKGEKKV